MLDSYLEDEGGPLPFGALQQSHCTLERGGELSYSGVLATNNVDISEGGRTVLGRTRAHEFTRGGVPDSPANTTA